MSSRASEPFLDGERLAALVDPVPVVLLGTQELTGLLPDDFGVYGGAARIWWMGFTAQDPP